MAMIAMTTNSSMSVKPLLRVLSIVFIGRIPRCRREPIEPAQVSLLQRAHRRIEHLCDNRAQWIRKNLHLRAVDSLCNLFKSSGGFCCAAENVGLFRAVTVRSTHFLGSAWPSANEIAPLKP